MYTITFRWDGRSSWVTFPNCSQAWAIIEAQRLATLGCEVLIVKA